MNMIRLTERVKQAFLLISLCSIFPGALCAGASGAGRSDAQAEDFALQAKAEQLESAASAKKGKAVQLALTGTFRLRGGTTDPGQCNLYELRIPVPAGRTADALILPREERMRLFAVTLAGGGTSHTADLSGAFTRDGIGRLEETSPGDLDGRGRALPAGVIEERRSSESASVVRAFSGAPFLIPPLGPGAKNVVDCVGQTIPLPGAADSRQAVHVLAASMRGQTRAKLALRLRDGAGKDSQTEFYADIPDWRKKEETGTRESRPLKRLALALGEIAEPDRAVLTNLKAELGPGAKAAPQAEELREGRGFTWTGDLTDTTFTVEADLQALFPGKDFTKTRVVVCAGADDNGAIYAAGRKVDDFHWDEGRGVVCEGAVPTSPLNIQIVCRNETGAGRLMFARAEAESIAAWDYIRLITDLADFEVLAQDSFEAKALCAQAKSALAAALPVDAFVSGNSDAIAAAAAQFRQALAPLSGFAKARRLHLAGYAHIDLAWLWPFSETIESVIPLTFLQALRFMDEFPDFCFSMTEAQKFRWVEQLHPEMFRGIARRVREGRWEILGGTWCEPDCNLPNGESFVRQVLYGKQYFRDKLGADVRTAMNPDSFGYHWQLPQIFRQSGFDAFITQKISWNETWEFPHKLFWWEGADGSRILTYFPIGGYCNIVLHEDLMRDMRNFEQQTSGVRDLLVLYGVGDHGGGPTRAMIRRARGIEESPILPRAVFGRTDSYFADLASSGTADRGQDAHAPDNDRLAARAAAFRDLPVWSDELYLEKHRGTYTTHADVKDGNRRSERLLYSAELAAALAWLGREDAAGSAPKFAPGNAKETLRVASGPRAVFPVQPSKKLWRGLFSPLPEETTYPANLFRRAWQDICLLQMHDILPGSGIRQNYEEALRICSDLQTSAGAELVRSLGEIAARQLRGAQVSGETHDSRIVFNLLPWARTAVCEVQPPDGAPVAVNTRGQTLPQQISPTDPKRSLVQVSLPACGYTVIRFEAGKAPKPVKAPATTLENRWVRIKIDLRTGNLSSIFEKQSGREMLGDYTTASRTTAMQTSRPERFEDSHLVPKSAGLQGNILQFYGDWPREYDAWDLGSTGRLDELSTCVAVSSVTSGPLFSEITVRKRYGRSAFEQTFRVCASQPWVEVRNSFDWHERHILLKTAFPLSVRNKWANYEIPFGAISRPAIRTAKSEIGKYEHAGLQWGNLDDASGAAGLALFTVNKYGFDATDNVLRLSLLRGPDSPNEHADAGRPLTDEGRHEFTYAIFPHSGTWQDADVARRASEFNYPPIPLAINLPDGAKAEESMLELGPDNVMLSSIKKSEDGGDVIVRVYESEGRAVEKAELRLPWDISSVQACDLLERPMPGAKAPEISGRTLRFPLQRFQIASFRLAVKNGS